MKIHPRGKYVLVERDDAPSRESRHGIVAPTSIEQEQKAYGTVVAFGPEIKDLKKGDRVIYGAFAGEELEEDGKEYRLLEDEHIIAFIK